MQIIGIGGVPASGKSLLMKSIISQMNQCGSTSLEFGLVKGFVLPEMKVIVLGKYAKGQEYPGTDRLSMGVQPDAEKLVDHLASCREWNFHTLLFEGDRLFNEKFINCCNQHAWTICHWLLLTIPEKMQRVRLKARSAREITLAGMDRSGPSEDWLKGRATKAENLSKRKDILISQHEKSSQTMALTREIVARIRKFAGG